MGYHTFDVEEAERLEDAGSRYRYLSREELLAALSPREDDRIADLGSGTGFYTDDVAPHVARVFAVDVQPAMHAHYREKGLPENVALVSSTVAELPFGTDALDGAFSTMTYHEFASPPAIAELARVVAPGGRVVLVDWSADGDGEAGPPLDERYTAADAADALRDGGFEIHEETTRPETFLLVAGVT